MNETLTVITRQLIKHYKAHEIAELIARLALVKANLSRWEYAAVEQAFNAWHSKHVIRYIDASALDVAEYGDGDFNQSNYMRQLNR